MSGLNSLATLIKRLEAATSRLEDLTEFREHASPATFGGLPAELDDTGLNSSGAGTAAPEDPKSVLAFDEDVVDGKLKPFVELTRSFCANPVVEQVSLFEKMFGDLRGVLRVAALCKKPTQTEFAALLNPLQEDISTITHMKEAFRKERDWVPHLLTVAEGAPCVGWVTVEPKPGPMVNDVKESTLFYGNRVIKEFKEKDARHAQWVTAYIAVLEQLRLYVMEYHTTGLVWNPKGVTVDEFQSLPLSGSSSAGPAVASPPPPPPPPPPAAPAAAAVATPPAPSTSPVGGAEAVFAQINRGDEVTKGLRKVEKSEMTHKNPSLRASGVVPESTSPKPVKKPLKPSKPQSLMGKKPPKLALEGNKWLIEYQENESQLTIEETERTHVISLFACKSSTIIIKGKVNAVTLVNCTKTSVLVESVISSISVTKSPSFTIQITGHAPTIQLDSSDSGQIYLSKECVGIEITTAKCSAINVSLPEEEEEEGVFKEFAIPEMLKTVVENGKLVTSVVEHIG